MKTHAIEQATERGLSPEQARVLMSRREVEVGDVVYIPRGVVHRLEIASKDPLHIFEVQAGLCR